MSQWPLSVPAASLLPSGCGLMMPRAKAALVVVDPAA